MPFFERRRPSIQLGLLGAIGRQAGFSVSTLHANLDLVSRLGADRYDQLANHRGRMLGDWLFSVEAFGAAAPDPDGMLLREFESELVDIDADLLFMRRQVIPAYLEHLVDGYPWGEADVVGFSSTFQQNAASFALARRLKARWPDIVTLFGGANFDGDMGLEHVRTVDCIDYAVIGEADTALPQLLTALATGTDPGAVAGVARRVSDTVVATPQAPPLRTLDDLPDPDYAEYFDRAQHLSLMSSTQRRSTWLPLESARGCWWGEKHHCTFCGLNGTSMAFRSKSPSRVADEMARQSRKYGSFHFEAVDNILDLRYIDQLMPALEETRTDYELFYEVKANLTRNQIRQLAAGGVRAVQPGIESLSSHVLHLMRKGVRAGQNVNLLRWAQYYGIRVEWNLLWGFPGETAHDYAAQVSAMPSLHHLRPPSAVSRIWLERFSPLFTDAAKQGIHHTPERSYRFVYPADVDLDRAAYFFEYDMDGALPDTMYEPLTDAVATWADAWKDTPPVLTSRWSPGHLQIQDTRPRDAGTYTFRGDLADIYAACMDRPITATAVQRKLGLNMTAETIDEAFREFAERGLMFIDESRAVSLALPAVPGR